MSYMQTFKEYLGLVPMETVDDDYLDSGDDNRRTHRAESLADDQRRTPPRRPYDELPPVAPKPRSAYGETDDARFAYERPRAPRPTPPRIAAAGPESNPHIPGFRAQERPVTRIARTPSASRISTLKPDSYSEAGAIGNRFREGNAVVMDLSGVAADDARRFVDFAAGLVYIVNGTLEKLGHRVFLLSHPNAVISSADRERIERELHGEAAKNNDKA